MAIKWKHDDSYRMYFCTFTCYSWLWLFEIVNGYDLVYSLFDVLKADGHYTVAYVVMPNHVHVILYFPRLGFDLNKIIGNAKRFMAYEITDRLGLLGEKIYWIIWENQFQKGKGKKDSCIKYLLIHLKRYEPFDFRLL